MLLRIAVQVVVSYLKITAAFTVTIGDIPNDKKIHLHVLDLHSISKLLNLQEKNW